MLLFYCRAGLSHDQLEALRTPLLTPEQQAAVRSLQPRGVQGRPLTAAVKATALSIADAMCTKLHVTTDAAIKVAAEALGHSHRTLRLAAAELSTTDILTSVDCSTLGRGNPDHPLNSNNTDVYGPSLEAELLMHELVHKQKTDGVCVTSATIAAEMRAQLGLSLHRSTVRRWLRALGYRWRHKRYVGGMKPQAKNIRIRQFIMEYAAALAEEERGTAVIVYVDESYIHSHHASKKGWFHPTDRDVIGDDAGKRLIILHAMTDSGLLAVPDTVASNWLSEPALTAELVFEEVLEDGQDDSDYHNTMTGAKFVAWLRHRLLPTFAELHPGKKMYLVLDNASYHKPRDESWVSGSKAKNKHELTHTLLDLGVTQLTTVGDSPRTVPAHRFEAPVGAGGPTKDDLIAAIQLWLDQHPDHNRTVVEQLMDDAGHSLIYTPPFCPEVQPIELLWAKIKRYVADRATHNRSMTEAREQTEEAFEQITKLYCNSVVRHCHDWIDQFIASDGAQDLRQCGTLAGVIKHLSLLNIASAETSTASAVKICPPPPAAAAPSPSAARALRRRH